MIPDYSGDESKDSRNARRRKQWWQWRRTIFCACLFPYLVLIFFHRAGAEVAGVGATFTMQFLTLVALFAALVALVLAWLEKLPDSVGFGTGVGVLLFCFDLLTAFLHRR